MAGFTSRQPRAVVTGDCSAVTDTIGARLIDSTPPATATEASPTAMARLASTTASIPEPHRRLTVTPGTVTGRPASRTAIRATSRLSSPAWLPAPMNTSSMADRSRPGSRSTSAASTVAARSSGRTPA